MDKKKVAECRQPLHILYIIYKSRRLDEFKILFDGLNLLVEFSQYLVELLN